MELNSEKRIQMKFLSDVSLTDRAYFTVVSALWNQENVCLCIKDNLLDRGRENKWSEIENLVFSSLEKLILPDACKFRLKNLIQPMGHQILHWISIAKSSFQIFGDYTVKLHFMWNEKGVFDCIKTAKLVIDNNLSNKFLCYSIGCIFCIEEFVSKPDVSVHLGSFYKKLLRYPFTSDLFLVLIWCRKLGLLNGTCDSHDVDEEVLQMHPDDLGFSSVEGLFCVPLMKYFLEQFSPSKKKIRIKNTLRSIFNKTRPQCGNVLLFLFSYLDEAEMNDLICKNAYATLSCLLEWPNQEFFMTVANCTWNNLSEIQYFNLFLDIAEYVSQFHESCIYKNILEEFWKSPPSAFREYVIRKCVSGTALSRLFLLRNTDDIVKMILDDCSPETKHQIIFYFESMNICDFLLKVHRWESLKMFILSCISSTDILEEFLLYYQNYWPSYRTKETEENIPAFIEKVKCWY